MTTRTLVKFETFVFNIRAEEMKGNLDSPAKRLVQWGFGCKYIANNKQWINI